MVLTNLDKTIQVAQINQEHRGRRRFSNLLYVKCCLIVVAGILLLRMSGRKSISQMTIGSTVVMLMIGSVLASPITTNGLWSMAVIVAVAIGTLVAIEVLELKSKVVARFISGRALLVIENGEIITDNLRRLRIPIDKLHMRLRLVGINDVSVVKKATIEVNGQLGYELIDEAKPMTKAQFHTIMEHYLEAFSRSIPKPPQPDLEHHVHIIDKDSLRVPHGDMDHHLH